MRSALRSVIVAAALAVSPAHAADIRLLDLPAIGWAIAIRGEIVAGDDVKVHRLIGDRTIRAVGLGGPGGNLDVALAIVGMLKAQPVEVTYIMANCESACGLIFLLAPSRFFMLMAGARIGVHQVQRDGAADLESTAEVAQLMRRAGLPQGWITLMQTTSPHRMVHLPSEALAAGLGREMVPYVP
jgi:hypothetical protein